MSNIRADEITGEDNFRETFDLSGPGQEWACMMTNEFKRMVD